MRLVLLGLVLASGGPALGGEAHSLHELAGPSPKTTFYWVERDPRGGLGSVGRSDGQTVRTGVAKCVAVKSGLMVRDWGGERRTHVTFATTRLGDGSLRLSAPTVSLGGRSLATNCHIPIRFLHQQDGTLITNRGPIFREKSACEAASGRPFEQVCRGNQCTFSPQGAPVFNVEACVVRIEHALSVLRTVARATEVERLQAQEQFVATWRAGGQLFERTGTICRALEVVPGEDELIADVGYGTEDFPGAWSRATWRIRPTSGMADRTRVSGGGLVGVYGRSDGGALPLFFATHRAYLGDRWLFFTEEACLRELP